MNANQVMELDISVSLMRDYMCHRPLSPVDLTEDDIPVREESVEVEIPHCSMSPMWDRGAVSACKIRSQKFFYFLQVSPFTLGTRGSVPGWDIASTLQGNG